MKTTVIQKADYVLGWDEDSQRHIYMTGADVAFVYEVDVIGQPRYLVG